MNIIWEFSDPFVKKGEGFVVFLKMWCNLNGPSGYCLNVSHVIVNFIASLLPCFYIAQ